jgi:hypothetical protein
MSIRADQQYRISRTFEVPGVQQKEEFACQNKELGAFFTNTKDTSDKGGENK